MPSLDALALLGREHYDGGTGYFRRATRLMVGLNTSSKPLPFSKVAINILMHVTEVAGVSMTF
jgi:hypothetical protein